MIPSSILALLYLAASAMFIIGLKQLASPATARQGNMISGGGMLLAVVVTLLDGGIVSFGVIAAGVFVGGALGLWMAKSVEMTAMPQLVAVLNGLGGAASLTVGGAEFLMAAEEGRPLALGILVAILLTVIIGGVTFTGSSLVAYAKLQELITTKPITWPGQKAMSAAVLLGIVGLSAWQFIAPEPSLWALYAVAALSLVLGVMLTIPIGGADMPVVIALLNSYSGLAVATTGFVISNHLLIIAGALVGSSGIILTRIMCRAMNRSLGNVLFGAFGATVAGSKRSAEGLVAKQLSVEDFAVQLAYARLVVVIPGYGLAVAQAQHQIRELADLVEKQGGEVKYAIHPVAGRMPGHMNVLLSEANVPYDRLITDVDEANAVLPTADVAIIIGANDIVNPAALEDPASPIAGMPIIRADMAPRAVVMKRSMASGFAGIENDLFFRENTWMLFGDAKKTLTGLITEVKQEVGAGV